MGAAAIMQIPDEGVLASLDRGQRFLRQAGAHLGAQLASQSAMVAGFYDRPGGAKKDSETITHWIDPQKTAGSPILRTGRGRHQPGRGPCQPTAPFAVPVGVFAGRQKLLA